MKVKKVPEEKAVKPSSKAKAKRAPSGRSSRKIVKDDSDEETSKKNFTDTTRAIASLSYVRRLLWKNKQGFQDPQFNLYND
ncbi:hypothetical protein SeLEV6574_g08173 [Synchytrium endobioticum]|uniref:Uncharacterized protein n=1 Tax=Synchytrium endobioticum TaxID=286115 RepID=A0A507CCG3_9FUNG|nr:hypothetical protein SeLEV6574_g08173 [Synchytrium endobioticum]